MWRVRLVVASGSTSPSVSGAPNPAAATIPISRTLRLREEGRYGPAAVHHDADGTSGGSRRSANTMTSRRSDGERVAFMFEHSQEEKPYCSIAIVNAAAAGSGIFGPYSAAAAAAPASPRTESGRDGRLQRCQGGRADRDDGRRRAAARLVRGLGFRRRCVDPQRSTPISKAITFVRLAEEGATRWRIRPDGYDVRRLLPNRWNFGASTSGRPTAS